jgi:hypothetical protein
MVNALLKTAGLLLIAAGLASCSKSDPPAGGVNLDSGVIARWPAEGSATRMVAGHPATLTGGVTVVFGETSRAFSFDGASGRVVVPDSPELNFRAGKDFSIAAWIKPLPANTSFGVMSIVDKRKVSGITAALGYSFHLDDGRLACQLAPAARWPLRFCDFTSWSSISAVWQRRKQLVPMKFSSFVSPGPDLRDGEFHHVAMTIERRSRTGGKLYVDGEVVLTFDPTGQTGNLANTEPLLIGAHPDPALRCAFKGVIDDVRLYSRALAASEVEALSRGKEATGGGKH